MITSMRGRSITTHIVDPLPSLRMSVVAPSRRPLAPRPTRTIWTSGAAAGRGMEQRTRHIKIIVRCMVQLPVRVDERGRAQGSEGYAEGIGGRLSAASSSF